jgi:hypothetical protein
MVRAFNSNSEKKLPLNRKSAIVLLVVVMVLAGCTRSAQKTDVPIEQPVVTKNEIILEKPALSPSAVSPGGTLRQELKYFVSAEKTGKLKVLEVITISGKDLKMELSRKESERVRGDQISTFQFKVPKGLPPGEYRLITTISVGKMSRNATGSFRVK